MNFNPIWTLPPTVIKEDLIPKGRDMQSKGQNVLEKFGIDAYEGGKKMASEKIDWSSGKPLQLSYRQAPGKENPLGFLKINFPSASSVYMHDSPKESLFGRNFRAASSGCVRVQNIEELAAWLLEGQPGWTKEQVEAMRENGQTKTVRLKKPMPCFSPMLPPGRRRMAWSSSGPTSTRRMASARSLRHTSPTLQTLIGIKGREARGP